MRTSRRGDPADVNPMNSGIDSTSQNGVTVPSNAPSNSADTMKRQGSCLSFRREVACTYVEPKMTPRSTKLSHSR